MSDTAEEGISNTAPYMSQEVLRGLPADINFLRIGPWYHGTGQVFFWRSRSLKGVTQQMLIDMSRARMGKGTQLGLGLRSSVALSPPFPLPTLV